MKIHASLIYMFTFIAYLVFGDGGSLSGGFNIITQLCYMSALCVFILHPKENTKLERLFFQFIIFLTCVRVIYTVICMIIENNLVVYNTDIFTFVACASFAIFLLYCATHYKSLR